MLSSVFSVSLWFGTSEMGFRRSELGGTMTSLGVVPFAFLCGLLLIAQPQFPIFDLQSPSALNRLHTGAPVPDLRSSISHLRSQAFRIPLAPCRFAAHAFLCVLCVSVVQFGTVTVIEGIHHRDAEYTEKTLILKRPQHLIPPSHAFLCVLCVSVVQFGAMAVIEGLHHRDAEYTEKTLIHRRWQRHAKGQVLTLPCFTFLRDLLAGRQASPLRCMNWPWSKTAGHRFRLR